MSAELRTPGRVGGALMRGISPVLATLSVERLNLKGAHSHTHSFPFALHVKGSVCFVRLHIKGSVRRLFVGCGLYEHEHDGTVIRSHLEGSRTAF